MKNLKLFAVALLLIAAACTNQEFYHVEDCRIVYKDQPQYYIGTNVWYASRLALEDPERLVAELDTLKSLGMTNLRILATDENFEGLDIVFKELRAREMSAVLYLNNAWEWTDDCYISWLERAGAGKQPHPATDGYGAYMSAMWKFASNPKAVELYQEHVKRVVSRYKDEPAVFSWQICNEPRPFTSDPEALEDYIKYIQGTARLIKSIDRNHMVSTGNEGAMGCEGDINLFERVHNCPDIDYLTIHIWPYNWSWVREGNVTEGVNAAISSTGQYISAHLEKAYYLNKPVVIEEFGYPRDGFEYTKDTPVTARDSYYAFVFGKVLESAKSGGRLAGCNFWAWSGFAEQTPGHQFWQEGDELCGDPFQEAQGLNGVYLSDESTISVISKYTKKIGECVSIITSPDNWLFDGNKPYKLDIALSCPGHAEGVLGVKLMTDIGQNSNDFEIVHNYEQEYNFTGTRKVSFGLADVEPGFYKVQFSISKPHPDGMHTFDAGESFFIGIKPELVESPQDKQPDFDEFWDRTLSELAEVEPEYQMELLPEHSNELRNTYRVTMKSLGGETIGGILCMPVKEGKYKAYIDYMGYGADPYYFDPSSEPECIEFLACARNQGIFRDEPRDWFQRGIESKETYYYRGAFCDVIRAIDFVASLGQTDPARIVARGESQGGAFTWVAASLDSRIAAAAPAVPFLSDYPHYGKIVDWPVGEALRVWAAKGIPEEEALKTLSYFDIKNLADRVSCPVYMAFGLQDPTCPPHTNFAGYNQIKSEKHYYCVPTCGHAMWMEKSWGQGVRKAFLDRY